jgi:hypoxanthine phosphoribosyltransferase
VVGPLVVNLDDVDSSTQAFVRDLLDRSFLEASRGPIEIACSGGPDSTGLAVLASLTGRSVTLHYVDHGLRASSGHEGAHVKELASLLGAGFVEHQVAVDGTRNVEASARAARKRVLPDSAATGHTMDDQAETVLINLLRGTGLDGLGAMAFDERHPVLELRRRELAELCQRLGLSVVVDETNTDLRFVRNKVRHQLLPLLDEIAGRDVVPLFARTAQLAGSEGAFLDRYANEQITDVEDVQGLRAHDPVVVARRLRQWIRSQTFDDQASYPPSAAEISRIMDVVEGSARATQLSGGHQVARARGRLRFERAGSDTLRPMGEAGQPPSWAAQDLGDVVVSAEAIKQRVQELGQQITKDYAENPPLLVCVLKGALHFMSDLSQAIELPVDVDFMAVSSYGSATQTSGVVRIVKDLDADLSGRHVLVVEDIIDSGLTLNYLRKYLGARGPASIEVCALLLKDGEQRIEPDFRYVGFTIPPSFVVGYGLDVAERYRNLDGIYTYVGEGSH